MKGGCKCSGWTRFDINQWCEIHAVSGKVTEQVAKELTEGLKRTIERAKVRIKALAPSRGEGETT